MIYCRRVVKVHRILFVESGMTGGGSFESLFQYLKRIDRSLYKPFVVFLNRTKYYDLIKDLNIPCFLIFDLLYNEDFYHNHPFLYKLIGKTKLFIDLYCSFFSLFLDRFYHHIAIKKIIEIIKKEKIEILHANNQANRDFYVIECTRKTKIPCIIHLRSFFSKGFNPKKAQFANRFVFKYIAYSHSIAEHWIEKGIDSKKISIIHNAIDDNVNVDKLNLYDFYNIPKGNKIIGIVGKIIPARGHKFLMRAFARVFETRKDVHLLIVGGGEGKYIFSLKKKSEQLKIGSHTTFAGHDTNAKNIIAALDILVLPYSIEPFGRVLLEAWLLKTPVVLTDVGHIRMVVSDKKNCMLVSPGNHAKLKQILIDLLENEAMRKSLSINGYETCVNKFSIQKYCEKIEEIYSQAF